MMADFFIPLSCVFFLFSLFSGRHRRYTAILAWITIIIVLFSGIPQWLEESIILYPAMAVLSLPFLAATVRMLLRDEPSVLHLTRAAGVAFLIYAPFGFFPPAGDALISLVVTHTGMILDLLGFSYYQVFWNTFGHNSLRVEIILACTGIQAIAIMLGVAAAVPTTIRQKSLSLLLIDLEC